MEKESKTRQKPIGSILTVGFHTGMGFVLFLFALVISVGASSQPPIPQRTLHPRITPSVDEIPSREPVVLAEEQDAVGALRTLVAFPAKADAYISSEKADQSFGLGPLYLGYNLDGDHFGAQRILFYFDVTSIPTDAVVHDATLHLRVSSFHPLNDDPMPTILRRLASAWEEPSVTWNSEPTWGEIRAQASVGSALNWYEWNVTELVADWVAGRHENYGVEIIGDERVQHRERVFYSRETGTELFPRLVVDYTRLDDVRPPDVSVDPLPSYVTRGFEVSWSGTDRGPAGIEHYDVQYRVDAGEWVDWRIDIEHTVDEFVDGQHGRLYEFRARATDRAGNVEPFGPAEAQTRVDNRVPASQVKALPAVLRQRTIDVSWTGDDDGSGIQYYDVRYRHNGENWVLWIPETIGTGGVLFDADEGVYEFEVRAVDRVGLKEAFQGQAEAAVAVDVEAPFVEPMLWLPVLYRR